MEKILSGFELFAGLPKTVLTNFNNLGTNRRLAAGEILFHQHDKGDEAFLIINGGIRIERINQEGDRVLINILGPGEFFGETSLLTGNPRMAAAVAQVETLLFGVKTAQFQTMLTLHPQMSERLMRLISQRLTVVSAKFEEAGLNALSSRLAGLLLDFMNRFSNAKLKPRVIDIKLTQSDLAELTLSSREHINKILKNWEKEEILSFKTGKITILSPEKLQEFH